MDFPVYKPVSYKGLFLLISLCCFQSTAAQRTKQGCTIPISQIDEDSPLILQEENRKGVYPFHVPDGPGSEFISFNSGYAVKFACPDAKDNSLVIAQSDIADSEVVALCKKGTTFTIDGDSYEFSSIRCKKSPQSTLKEEGSCDKKRTKKYSIGFNLKEDFVGFIEVCYDTKEHTTVNTKYLLSRSIDNRETDVQRRSSFLKSNFGTDLADSPDEFYKCKNQIENFGQTLGSKKQAEKYIICGSGSDIYLARGHLVPNADFVFGYLQRATSYYINVAPQWQTVNGGNWKVLENRIRLYAHSRNTDLTVITGTLNVATLPDTRSQEHQLYMTTDAKNNPTVPVPALFWKLVHDDAKNAGIVFVGVNDPHHKDLEEQGYIVCTDICDKTTSWFDKWNRFDIENGYVYCCSVEDFASETGLKFFSSKKKLLLR